MALYGGMSKGERNRIKIRVRSAMTVQTAMEGRYLGGRPPYGYRLADAGVHPNPAKALDGKRLHRLELNPLAAPVVERIYREFLAGSGIYAIAEGLTRDGILSPSASDPGRNPHRNVAAWGKSAVRVILTNPRYIGRQVWNKQRKAEILIDVEDVALGHETKMRWNPSTEWIYSTERVHDALIDDETFTAVEARIAAGARRPDVSSNGQHRSQAEKAVAEADLRGLTGRQTMTADEIRTMVDAMSGIGAILRTAAPEDKIEIYRLAGLKLTYKPGLHVVSAEARPSGSCTKVCPRGDSNPQALQICTPKVCMWLTVVLRPPGRQSVEASSDRRTCCAGSHGLIAARCFEGSMQVPQPAPGAYLDGECRIVDVGMEWSDRAD